MPAVHLVALSPDELELLLANPTTYAEIRGLTLAPCERQVGDVAAMTRDFYARVPPAPPWCSYLAADDGGRVVGSCAYKSSPVDGVVEIAYWTFPPHEGKGFATGMAAGLLQIGRGHGLRVIAHTLAEVNASGRALSKAGFTKVGEAVDPEDGPVWRWEHLG